MNVIEKVIEAQREKLSASGLSDKIVDKLLLMIATELMMLVIEQNAALRMEYALKHVPPTAGDMTATIAAAMALKLTDFEE